MIVTVWGSSGAGRTLFSTLLAREFAEKRQTLLISFDVNTPMLPVWLPKAEIDRGKSLGNLFSNMEINTDVLAGAVVIPEKSRNLGLVGYLLRDRFLDFAEESTEALSGLVRSAAQLAEVVVLDCPSDLSAPVLPVALELCSHSFCLLTPDLRGAAYFTCAKGIMAQNPHLGWDNTGFIASPVKPFHAVDAMESLTGALVAKLPYCEELEVGCTEGRMLSCTLPSKYKTAISRLLGECQDG